ncbi:glycosyltransferase [Cellulomonas edaphi]|uniref:Glycosyltransferase n=1 Tax=Cellulomonas edaphi TaxID=3053468 RepID=A0ABT7S8N9_9CELL|nr:glycosyltransferase [Cellulomons edaphi]MDM7831993.1 glycosyltransferase [Cellulomons edaphi]
MYPSAPPLLVDGPAVDDTYDIAYLTKYVGKRDTGIAFTDRAYLRVMARSPYATLVLGNGMPATYPGDGLAYTTQLAEYRRRDPRLHLVNGMGSFVWHLRDGYLPEHRGAHKVAIMHEEPAAFDFYATDVWNRAHVRDVLMAAQDGFVFVSQRSRDLWVEYAGLHDAPLLVVPNTCAEEAHITERFRDVERTDLARALGLPAGALHLVMVGTVQRLKGQLEVVEAVRRLRASRRDLAVHLTIVGRVREHDYGEELERYVAEHALQDVVTVVGEVPKNRALEHIAAADALVLASHTEAMPLVLLEAMQLGTPVVATPVGGVPEVVDERSALLFEPVDVDALVARIEQVADDPAAAAELAAAGERRYWAEFSNERFARRFGDALHAMADAAGLTSSVGSVGGAGVEVTTRTTDDGLDVRADVARDASDSRWRALVDAWSRTAPLARVEVRTDGDLAGALALAAPLARAGLSVAEISAPALSLVCTPGEPAAAAVPSGQVLAIVGGPAHQVAYAEHIRTEARRRARARTLAAAEAERLADTAGPEPAPGLVARARRRLGALHRRRPAPGLAGTAAPHHQDPEPQGAEPRGPLVAFVLNSPMQLMAALSLWDATFGESQPDARLVALVHSTNGAAGFAEGLVRLCRRTERFERVVDVTAAVREIYAAPPSVRAVQVLAGRLRDAWGPSLPDRVLVTGYLSARFHKLLLEVLGDTPVHVFEDGLGSYVPKSIKLHDSGQADRVASKDCAEAAHIRALSSVDLLLRRVPVPQHYRADVPRIDFPAVRVGAYGVDHAHFARLFEARGRAFAPDEVLLVAQNFVDHLRPRDAVQAAEREANDTVIAALLAQGLRVVVRPHPRASERTWGERWDGHPGVVVWDDEPLLPVEVLLRADAPPAFAVGATSSCLFYLDELTAVPALRFPDEVLDGLRAHANPEHLWMLDLAAAVLEPLPVGSAVASRALTP